VNERHDEDRRLVDALRHLAGEIHQLQHAFLDRMAEMECKIMSAISDYATAVNASFDAIDKAMDGVNTSLSGVSDDVAFLKETILQLQTTPEDVALLTAAQTRATGLADRFTAFQAAIEALNAATERPSPPA